MQPRSKLDRLVFTERLVEAGLSLLSEAQEFAKNDLTRARGVRNLRGVSLSRGIVASILSTKTCRPETGLAGWACRIRTGESAREPSDWICLATSPQVARAGRRRPFAFQLNGTDLQLVPSFRHMIAKGSQHPESDSGNLMGVEISCE